MNATSDWLDTYETWEAIAAAIGEHDYSYDLSDSSHRLDVIQIVCEAAAKLLEKQVTGAS